MTHPRGPAERNRGVLTLLAVLMCAGCVAATWWQVHRALDGNLLSRFYAVLWPLYGCYVAYLCVRLRRGANSLVGRDAAPPPEPIPEGEDEQVQAYNRYLAAKAADARRRRR